jgi:hypothetical protein
LTRENAIEFLDSQRAEILLSNPNKGESVAMMAVLVEAKTLPLLLMDTSPGGGPLKTQWVVLSTDRAKNLEELCAREFEIAIGAIRMSSDKPGRVLVMICPRAKYEKNEGIIYMLEESANQMQAEALLPQKRSAGA